jgi:hypothetical protein
VGLGQSNYRGGTLTSTLLPILYPLSATVGDYILKIIGFFRSLMHGYLVLHTVPTCYNILDADYYTHDLVVPYLQSMSLLYFDHYSVFFDKCIKAAGLKQQHAKS